MTELQPEEKKRPRRRRILEAYGTPLMVLKPGSIWSAAMEDLKRREHNAGTNGKPWDGTYRQYAFARKHVLKAETANDTIRAALGDLEAGQKSGKEMTRLIYSNRELLESALR